MQDSVFEKVLRRVYHFLARDLPLVLDRRQRYTGENLSARRATVTTRPSVARGSPPHGVTSYPARAVRRLSPLLLSRQAVARGSFRHSSPGTPHRQYPG